MNKNRIVIILFSLVGIIGFASQAQSAPNWYDPSWQYRKKITINGGLIDADLTDFPVLVKLTSSNFEFSQARSDGYDIRFTKSDG